MKVRAVSELVRLLLEVCFEAIDEDGLEPSEVLVATYCAAAAVSGRYARSSVAASEVHAEAYRVYEPVFRHARRI